MNLRTYIELSRHEVADRARRLWKAAGSPTGRDLEYWLRAEVELLLAKATNSSKRRVPGTNPSRSRTRQFLPRTPQSEWRNRNRYRLCSN